MDGVLGSNVVPLLVQWVGQHFVAYVVVVLVLVFVAGLLMVEMEPRPEWVRRSCVGVLAVAFLLMSAGLLNLLANA